MTDILSTLGSDDFGPDDQLTIGKLLAVELERLRAGEFVDTRYAYDEVELGIAPFASAPTDSERSTLLHSLIGKRESHAFFYLIAAPYTGPKKYRAKYETLVTKTVQLCLRLAQMGREYRHDIYTACSRVWLLQRPDERRLLNLIRPFDRSFTEIRKKLLEIAELDDPNILKLRARLELWCSVIDRMLNDRDKQHKPVAGEAIAMDPSIVCHESVGEGCVTMDIVAPSVENIFPASGRETQHDRSPQGQLTRIQDKSSSSDRSHGMIALRGQEILNGLHMRYAAPPCLYARLTDSEIERAVSACLERVHTSPGHLLLLLSMILGRSVERLTGIRSRENSADNLSLENWVRGKETIGLVYRPNLPRHKGLGFLAVEEENDLMLPLPPVIGNAVRKLLHENDGQLPSTNIKSAVRQLTKSVNSRITALRLLQSFQQSLTSSGTDEAIVGLLAGMAPEHCAALYYVNVETSAILDVYYGYLETRLPETVVKRWDLPQGRVGSRLRTSPKLVSALFTNQATRISQARKGADLDLIEFHNELVLYTWQLMALASATRAVTEPLGRLTDINISAGTLRLADKNNRRDGAHRTIAFGDLARQQIEEYNRNLLFTAESFTATNPKLAKSIQSALSGESSWLFLIRNRQAATLAPKNIQRILEHRWRVPLNWPRHFLRSWFLTRKFNRGAVRVFMGHADTGAAPQSRWDATSMFELRQLADDIDEFLSTLKIPVVTAWNTAI